MNININNLVSISEANQNFSKIARIVDEVAKMILAKRMKAFEELLESVLNATFFIAVMKNVTEKDDHFTTVISKKLNNNEIIGIICLSI